MSLAALPKFLTLRFLPGTSNYNSPYCYETYLFAAFMQKHKAMLTGPPGKISPAEASANFQATRHYLQSLPF
jgi:hypothetical protein